MMQYRFYQATPQGGFKNDNTNMSHTNDDDEALCDVINDAMENNYGDVFQQGGGVGGGGEGSATCVSSLEATGGYTGVEMEGREGSGGMYGDTGAMVPGTGAFPRTSPGLCKVCGDEATGMYFGALVCVPCKTFFLRYAGDSFSFVCKGNRDCEITVTSRTQCKYCRYHKCLEAGMYRRVRPAQVQLSEGQQLCVVCHDLANGIHFGAITCEGCKKFFRRGLTENKQYSCKGGFNCLINPRTRNACRFCRYQTCLRMGMSREAIQMGRPSKITDNMSSIRAPQPHSSAGHDASNNPSASLRDSPHGALPYTTSQLVPHHSVIKQPHYRDDNENQPGIKDRQWGAASSGSYGNDNFGQPMSDGLEMFEPVPKRILSDGYQSSPSGSFSSSGSVCTTERSGSTDSGRSILSNSSPEMIASGRKRAWLPADAISLEGQYAGGRQQHQGSPSSFRLDNTRQHLETVQEQFYNLPLMLSEHLPNEFLHQRSGADVPHTITSNEASSSDYQLHSIRSAGRMYARKGELQFDSTTPGNTAQEMNDIFGSNASSGHADSHSRLCVNQAFDFDSEFAALSTELNSGDIFPRNVSDDGRGVADILKSKHNFLDPETMANSAIKAQKVPMILNHGSSYKGQLSVPFPLNMISVGQQQQQPQDNYAFSKSTSTNIMSSLKQEHGGQLSDSASGSSDSYTRSSAGVENSSRLNRVTASSATSGDCSASSSSRSGGILDSSMQLSAKVLSLDAEGWISKIGQHDCDEEKDEEASAESSGRKVSASENAETEGSSDNFLLDGIITLEQQIAESTRYWENIKLPDENVVFAGKHWEVVNHVLPSYNRFVQLGTNVNRKLKQDFDKWLEKHKPEEYREQLSGWIQKEVVPIYTLTSITYLKSLPGFTTFHADDQTILIRLGQSQSRILVAALHWYDADEKNFRNFLSWREIKYGPTDVFKQRLIGYAEKVSQLDLDSVESALLNVLIILATDYPGLKRPDLIENYQRQILGTFRAYTTAKFGAPNTRLETLFRLIPDIRRLGLLHYKMTLTVTLGVAADDTKN